MDHGDTSKMENTQTLDKLYRPTELDEIVGNVTTVKAVKSLLNRPQDYPTSTLLQGPSGCGKTTLARLIAKELNAIGRDLKEYNISDMRGIDAAREIIDIIKIAPWGDRRVIILNECHKATNEFQNAMLEVLEESPAGNHFILCTTDPGKLLKTIKTRCTLFSVNTLVKRDLITLITQVIENESGSLGTNVIETIAESAEGSPRQALVILDAIFDVESEKDQIELAVNYSINKNGVFDLYKSLTTKTPWKKIAEIIKSMDRQDAENARYAMLALLERDILAGGAKGDRAVVVLDFFANSFYQSGRPGLTQACYFASKA